MDDEVPGRPAGEEAPRLPVMPGFREMALRLAAILTDEVTATTWGRLHDPREPMFLLGAYVNGTLAGIVHYLFHRSCWTIADYCYLQDLFVAETARNLGLGRTLIEAVEREARAAGASRVYWLTKEDNATARKLYDRVAERSGFIQYRKLF